MSQEAQEPAALEALEALGPDEELPDADPAPDQGSEDPALGRLPGPR